jgi:hypothetical protein
MVFTSLKHNVTINILGISAAITEYSPYTWNVKNYIVSSMIRHYRDVITQITNGHLDGHDSRVKIFRRSMPR